MKMLVVFVFVSVPIWLHSQISNSSFENATLTIGIYGRTDCGVITDETRNISEDSHLAEAVMDKTGISEIGTGFVYEYKEKKYIISCEHVLYKAGNIVGFDAHYNKYELELLGSDMPYDLVVLGFKKKDDEHNFEGLQIEDSDYENHETGIRHIGFWKIDGSANIKNGRFIKQVSYNNGSTPLTNIGYLESTATIPGGYSGGPVINENNKLVGMNTARNKHGTSYALNSKILKRHIEDIIEYGKVRRVFSGIEFVQTPDCEEIFIQSIINDSPASKRYTDLIDKKVYKLNGQSVSTIYDLLLIMEEVKPNETISVGLSTGEQIPIKVASLNDENLAKISKHSLRRYSYPKLNQTVEINNLSVVVDQDKQYVIKTAGIGENKVYCLNTLSQLGIIIRMCSLYGYVELGKDESHIYINEIKFSEDKSKRVLYY